MMQDEVIEKFRWLGSKAKQICGKKDKEKNKAKKFDDEFKNRAKVAPIQMGNQVKPMPKTDIDVASRY